MGNRNLRAGKITLQLNGRVLDAIGDFQLNLGRDKNEMLVGADRRHGYSSKPQAASIKGEIRDASDLDIDDILKMTDGTITVLAANGKTYLFSECVYTHEGDIGTEEGKIPFECGAMYAEPINP